MKSKLEQYKDELADLMETKNSPDVPKDIKSAIEPAINKLKSKIKEEESKPSPKPSKAEAKVEKKEPVAKKSEAAKKSGSALERCKEILAKYRDKKQTDAKRVEKRRKAGKPVELTPSETIKKAAKSVKAKVVEMDKGLKVSEEASIISGIISSVVSAISGIKDNHRKKMFISKIIEGLRKLEKGVSLKTAEDGMYLHNTENSEIHDDLSEMLRLSLVEIRHHGDEILEALKSGAEVEGWVISRSERAKTDMSDIAHSLDSSLKANAMADGGYMAKGGDTEEGVDLFQDYKKIPKNVQMVLDKYEEDFEDGNYKGLASALKELEKIGYTFEYYLDGVAYDLRKIGQKGKSEYMADGGKTSLLKEDDFVWNAVGKKLVVDKVTDDEYYLSGFMQPSASPFSKKKVDEYIRSGQWSLKPKMADGGESEEKLYKVVGKKNGQLVDISELPMTKEDANRFIKEQGIERNYQNVDIIIYRGSKPRFKYADGGMAEGYHQMPDGSTMANSAHMANGGMMAKGGLTKDSIVRTLTSDKSQYFLEKDSNGYILYISPRGAMNSTFHDKFNVEDLGNEGTKRKYKLTKLEDGGYMAKGGEIADIDKMKKSLIAKAKLKGIYQDFGHKEVRELEDKYGYTAAVQNFDNWAMNFDLSQMAMGGYMAKGGVAFKPYGKTKGRYTIKYKIDGVPDSEIWETKEMAIDNAKRYSSPKMNGEFTDIEIIDENGNSVDYMADGGYMAKGGVNKKYTHFAVSKADGKILNGFETISDIESLKYYAKMDMTDMGYKPSDYTILSKEALVRKGINPFDFSNWYKLEGGGYMAKGGMVYDELSEFNKSQVDKYGYRIGDDIIYALGEKGNILFPYREVKGGKIIGFLQKGKYKDLYVKTNYAKTIDYNKIINIMAMGGEMAKRGRLLSAINRDRAYTSEQEWEQGYKRKGSPKNPRYNTSYALGGQAPVKKYPMLSNIKTDLIN